MMLLFYLALFTVPMQVYGTSMAEFRSFMNQHRFRALRLLSTTTTEEPATPIAPQPEVPDLPVEVIGITAFPELIPQPTETPLLPESPEQPTAVPLEPVEVPEEARPEELPVQPNVPEQPVEVIETVTDSPSAPTEVPDFPDEEVETEETTAKSSSASTSTTTSSTTTSTTTGTTTSIPKTTRRVMMVTTKKRQPAPTIVPQVYTGALRNKNLGPVAAATNPVTKLVALPCCRDRFGEQACQALRKSQPSSFEKRCLNDHDFHTLDCCAECRQYMDKHLIAPENARVLQKAPTLCKDKHSVQFCRKFKSFGMGKYSCNDAEFAVRICRHSCGYCNDELYSSMSHAPPCASPFSDVSNSTRIRPGFLKLNAYNFIL